MNSSELSDFIVGRPQPDLAGAQASLRQLISTDGMVLLLQVLLAKAGFYNSLGAVDLTTEAGVRSAMERKGIAQGLQMVIDTIAELTETSDA